MNNEQNAKPTPPEAIEFLKSAGFEWKEMPFYNSIGDIGTPQYRNYLDRLPSYARLVRSHMGGNYGASDLYVCVDGNVVKRFQYYGDLSADVTDLDQYETVDELSKLISSVV